MPPEPTPAPSLPLRPRSLVLLPVASAFLFGAGTPLAKILVGTIEPLLLAGILYLGSGLGLVWAWAAFRAMGRAKAGASLSPADLPWLAGAAVLGGATAPALLVFGLRSMPASSASLLLALEGVLTAALARLFFREYLDVRVWLALCLITAGCAVLAWSPRAPLSFSPGAVLVAGACLGWAADNNLTRKISAGSPLQIAAVKGVTAGAVNVGLALALGASLPGPGPIAASAGVGFACYGASLILFVLSLRGMGAARTAGYFSVAPFAGVLLSEAILHEPLPPRLLVAAAVSGLGFYLLLGEHHEHEHRHRGPLEHSHAHGHSDGDDGAHDHGHPGAETADSGHDHAHVHPEWFHSHPHYPDLEHAHSHRRRRDRGS